jgi:hypothetical protein
MTSKNRALDNQSSYTSSSKSDSTLTRREALRWAVSAAAVGALGPTLLDACATNSSASPGDEVDVAIIGGGPSALYAAYRLLTGTPRSGSPVAKGSGKNGRPTVAIYEATDRLCGRIWSVVPPGAPHLIAEFGGMRFLDTQEIVPRLIKALNLPTVPFTVGNGQNLNYLRAVRFTMAQYSDPSVVPYMLPPSEQGMTPGQLTLQGIQTYVPNAPTLTGAQWETVKMTATYQGKLLADQGFWNLMEQALSPEGYSLMSDGIDYPSFFVENWNAVEQMQELAADFAPGASYFTIPGGYMRLPLTLAGLAQHAGASVHLKNRLTSLSPASGGGVNLTMSVPGGTSKVTAQHVIMALPKDPMEAVVERSPFLQLQQSLVDERRDHRRLLNHGPPDKTLLVLRFRGIPARGESLQHHFVAHVLQRLHSCRLLGGVRFFVGVQRSPGASCRPVGDGGERDPTAERAPRCRREPATLERLHKLGEPPLRQRIPLLERQCPQLGGHPLSP